MKDSKTLKELSDALEDVINGWTRNAAIYDECISRLDEVRFCLSSRTHVKFSLISEKAGRGCDSDWCILQNFAIDMYNTSAKAA